MQEWDVVGVIAALVALISAVIAPIVKLTHAIARLTTAWRTWKKGAEQLAANNRNAHERIWDNTHEQDASSATTNRASA